MMDMDGKPIDVVEVLAEAMDKPRWYVEARLALAERLDAARAAA